MLKVPRGHAYEATAVGGGMRSTSGRAGREGRNGGLIERVAAGSGH